MYRVKTGTLEVFLVHPGGPYWKNKDLGSWSIPKGEIEEGDDPLERAKLEFMEETGSKIEGNFIELNSIKQKGGKMVSAWAVKGDIDPATVKSNYVAIKWPPGSDKEIQIPEVDKGTWFTIEEATQKINSAQTELLKQLIELL